MARALLMVGLLAVLVAGIAGVALVVRSVGQRLRALPPPGGDGPPELPPPRALPGWYPDPGGSDRQRWWDGVGWTDEFRPPPA